MKKEDITRKMIDQGTLSSVHYQHRTIHRNNYPIRHSPNEMFENLGDERVKDIVHLLIYATCQSIDQEI